MKFTLTIDGNKYTATYTGYTARLWREQFRTDLLLTLTEANAKIISACGAADMSLMSDDMFTGLCVESITPELLEKIAWVLLATTAHDNGEDFPLYEHWLDSVENYNEMLYVAITGFHYMMGNVPVESSKAPQTQKKTLA